MDVQVVAHKMVEDPDAQIGANGEPVMVCQACGLQSCPIVTAQSILDRLGAPARVRRR